MQAIIPELPTTSSFLDGVLAACQRCLEASAEASVILR